MRSPFKFLDPYTRKDKDTFFGRDEEVEALLEMAKKNRLILIYGPSGAGKTSLVQCGLSNRFHATDWYPLFIRRNEDINRSLSGALAEGLGEQQYDNVTEAVDELYVEYLRPVYLIFDQLEELLILGSAEEQGRFVEDIARIQKAQLPCRILFLLREEYLAHLYHFEKAIPYLFTRRLRVEPMSRANVREVITRSCTAFNIAFENEAHNPEQIIDNVSRGKAGISLPYLQVYLDRLYQAGFQRTYQRERQGEELPELTFATEEIDSFGAIENVLEQFLTEQQDLIQASLKQRHPAIADNLAQQVLDVFVSDQGTKRPIPFQMEGQFIKVDPGAYPFLASLPAEVRTGCLQALQHSRILNDQGNAFELAHDSLAALIDEARTDEQRQRNEIKKRISNAFAEYQATGILLNRKQLISIEDFLEELQPALLPEVATFIQDSYEQAEQLERAELEEERRKRRRAIRFAVIGFVLAAIATVALFIAVQQWRAARQARLKMAKNAFEAQLSAAEVLKVNGQYTNALEQLEIAGNFASDDSETARADGLKERWRKVQQAMSRGDSLIQIEKFPQAIEQYQAADAISPDAHIAGEIKQARQQLNQLFESYMTAGNANFLARNFQRSSENYRRALELKPDDPKALEGLKRAQQNY